MKNSYLRKHNPIVTRIFLAMLAPTILMNLTTALASFADTVIIGFFLDDKSLSVVTYATPIYMIINTFAALFAVGGSIVMSIESGKGNKESAHKSFSLSVELLVLTGVILFLCGLFFSNMITSWLGAGEDVFNRVKTYSTIILFGAPVFMLNVGLAFFVRNDGRPVLSMVGMFLSIIVNIIADIIFIGPLGMGIAGAAYATVLGQLVSVVVISGHFLTKNNTLSFRFNMNIGVTRIIKNGSSTAMHFIYQFITILILNHFVSKMAGTNGVVIYTVVFNLYTVSLAVFEGISQTIQPMVSLYYGEKSYAKIKETLRLAFITIIVICGAVTLLLEIFPEAVPFIFGISDGLLVNRSIVAVRIFAVSMIIMTVNVVIGYYLQSTEHSLMSGILVSLRCFVIFLICVFILGRLFGMNGIWAAYTMSEVLTFVIYIVMSLCEKRKLLNKGTCVDFFLLNKIISESDLSYVYESCKAEYDGFISYVLNIANSDYKLSSEYVDAAGKYLAELGNCNINAAGKYVEFEIIGAENKIIIRDNLNHAVSGNVQGCISDISRSDYSPVLGWNRLLIW